MVSEKAPLTTHKWRAQSQHTTTCLGDQKEGEGGRISLMWMGRQVSQL